MSDIGFDGVAAAFVGILMLAVAAVGLIIEIVPRFRRGSWQKAAFIARASTLPPPSSFSSRPSTGRWR